jgi:hypothetical protein
MKSFLSLILSLCVTPFIIAQTFVSTSAENKNTVLEEFTGIKCTYCPDGHLRAQNLYNANPNDVVLINIHVGGYAVPGAGQPDFRTSFGSAISGQSTLSGYPAGTVNRHDFGTNGWDQNGGTAMSRGNWAAAAAVVMGESSPVNVANQTSLDLSSGALSSVTEVYYTGNSNTSTNKLTIALMQNNVPGPQTGGASYNPAAILPNGDYNHMHMLRHMLTGQWGESLDTTTTGYFKSVSHSYTIPANYTGVATSFADMEVSVFVAEGNQEIVTGAEATMTYIAPPNAFDVSTLNASFGGADYCLNGTSFVPSFDAVNQTANVVTSIEAQYTVNGGAAVNFTASGLSLAQNGTTTVTFPTVSLPAGDHEILYSINTLNGNQVDLLSSNNNGLSGSISALTAAPTATSLVENFNAAVLPSGTWQYSQNLPGAVFDNPNNIGANRFCVFGENSTTVDVSNCIRAAYGSSDWNNQSAAIIFDNIDLSNNATPNLTFDYAYALFNAGSGDGALDISISNDCGTTWTSVWSRVGTTLATGAPNSSGYFYPVPNTSDWAVASVDLSAYANQSSVSVKFGFSKGTSSNNLYVDNINFDMLTGVQMAESVEYLRIAPNPVRGQMQVDFSVDHYSTLDISVFNALGQQVLQVATDDYVGKHSMTVQTQALNSGIYFLNIRSEKGIKTARFVVE